MRLKPINVSLRTKRTLKAFRTAIKGAAQRGVHVNEFSLISNHLHMIVEVRDNKALARGMRSFGGGFGKAIRRFAGGAGAVFDGRFHMHVLTTPTEYRRALRYVLLNQSQHARRTPERDQFSSGVFFRRWVRLIGVKLALALGDHRERNSYLSPPRSWLAREGWTRAAA